MSGEQSGRNDWTLATAMAARLRSRPALALPYLFAGLLLSAASAVHAALPVPLADGAYPAQGLLHVEWAVVPAGMVAARVPVGTYPDLYPGYLAATLAIGALRWVAPAAAAASVLRRAGGDSWRPRVRDLAALVAVHVALPLAFLPLAVAGTAAGVFGLLAIGLLLFVVGRLFVVPALVVREGLGPWAAVTESLERMPGVTGTAIVAVVALGWLAYLLTGVTTLPWLPATVSHARPGTALSVWVVGTLHALAVTELYERVETR